MSTVKRWNQDKMYFVLSFILWILLFLEKFTPLAKILHCRRQWRHWQISPLVSGNWRLSGIKRSQVMSMGFFCLQQYSVGNFFLGHPVLISAQGLAAALNCPTSPPHNMVFVTAGFFHHYAHLNHHYYHEHSRTLWRAINLNLILTITMTTGPLPQRHLSPGASKCKSESAIKVMMYLYLYLYADCDFDDTTIFWGRFAKRENMGICRFAPFSSPLFLKQK